MKNQLLTLIGFFLFLSSYGQVIDSLTEKNIREKVLTGIQNNLDKKTKAIDSTVANIDKKLDLLDKAIKDSKTATDKADILIERVQSIEKKQIAIEENELNVYQANYQSAIINLVSMDREIKPLILFNTTKDFFTSLTETSNPMNYPGYNDWYKKFYAYIQKEKTQEATLNVLSNLISLTGDLAKGAPFGGPLVNSLFSGIGSFINSLGNGKKELRAESEKMFILTAKLSQFTHDKDLIESEWESITKELKGLQEFYDDILNQNLALIQVANSEFLRKFSNEYDANKRTKYLISLAQKGSDLVSNQKTANPKDWKESIYYQMMDVQSLKLRFGRITFTISQNIGRYSELIKKYKNDPDVGTKVQSLETKLNELQDTFDKTFEPLDYINSATRMYKVN